MYIATSKAASECLEPSTATRMFSNISTHEVILCIEKVFYETIVLVALHPNTSFVSITSVG
jgi:hypothetical protein